MINNSIKKKSSNICSQCGSELIFVSQETVKPEGSRYPQTNTVYRCLNTECQKKKDKEKADRMKLQKSKEVKEQERIEKNQELQKLKKSSI